MGRHQVDSMKCPYPIVKIYSAKWMPSVYSGIWWHKQLLIYLDSEAKLEPVKLPEIIKVEKKKKKEHEFTLFSNLYFTLVTQTLFHDFMTETRRGTTVTTARKCHWQGLKTETGEDGYKRLSARIQPNRQPWYGSSLLWACLSLGHLYYNWTVAL